MSLASNPHIRCVINLGNPLLAYMQASEPQGISVDMAQAWAKQNKQTCVFTVVKNAREAVELLEKQEVDLGFLAIDPSRAQHLQFTKAYLHIDGCYAVRNASTIGSIADVDQSHHQVVVGLGSAYDLFLSRHLQHAQLVKAPSSDTVVETFLGGQGDVAAGVKHQLELDLQKHAGLRMLPGYFMQIQQALAIHQQAGKEALESLQLFLSRFIESGQLKASMQKHQVTGASMVDNGA